VHLSPSTQRIVVVAVVLSSVAATSAGGPAEAIHLRINQVGYRPHDRKIALVLSKESLQGRKFEVRAAAGPAVVLAGEVGANRGPYGRFTYVHELDFGRLTTKGTYILVVGDAKSPPFVVAEGVPVDLLGKSLEFFRVQRCGDSSPKGHGVCHRLDGTARGGPSDGKPVPADGGWHDAGDYIKFLITVGYSTHLMLTTYLRHPGAFPDEDGNRVPDVLEEARIGLDWMKKLWDAPNKALYYQVSDASDHGTWRLPDKDTGPRPLFACEPGKGANVAGKAAASLALAAVIWSDRAQPYADPARAADYLSAARQIYAYGKERENAQPSNPPDFYRERSFADNMALAAVALHRATGDAAYLREAKDYARAAGNVEGFSWNDSHALAHYEAARADPSYVSEAAGHLKSNLDAARGFAEADPFRVGLKRLHWGSAPVMMGIALQAFWYRDLTGDGSYLGLGRDQWDYLLGRNPWGVCFVNGAGTTWSRRPHHQIADLTRTQLTGFWNEGPVPLSTFEPRKITLAGPDIYADFQTEGAIYHDDKEDYTTNEPTLTANATGLALSAWYAASR
jgi:hypothetical protein